MVSFLWIASFFPFPNLLPGSRFGPIHVRNATLLSMSGDIALCSLVTDFFVFMSPFIRWAPLNFGCLHAPRLQQSLGGIPRLYYRFPGVVLNRLSPPPSPCELFSPWLHLSRILLSSSLFELDFLRRSETKERIIFPPSFFSLGSLFPKSFGPLPPSRPALQVRCCVTGCSAVFENTAGSHPPCVPYYP